MSAECQVCGRQAAGEGFVEGAKVPLCETCAAYSSNFSFSKQFQEEMHERKFAKPASTASDVQARQAFSPKAVGELELVEDFGKRIAQAREKQGLTRTDLARKIMIQEKELEGFERQKYKPNESTIKKLEFALGVSLREALE